MAVNKDWPGGQNLNEKVIVALDVDSRTQALALAEALQGSGCWLKIGLELYALSGLELVETFKKMGFSLFLDLKLHDIPNTVERALRVLSTSGVDMVDVHCAGGYTMMARAAEVCHAAGIKVIGVTVLTSMGPKDLRELGVAAGPQEQVVNLARLAQKAGLDGVVASSQEAAVLRKELGPEFILVTPGIRPPGSAPNDQVRVVTPRAALQAGSSYLVVGRPVTRAADPRQALAALWQ
ncbi:MAG: orotidine-5'-phosphate decarboxylase [Firmicutes bacterium]|nr:orotidine-5'-phosphate decarboxylase [Bacillota bacterium]